MSLIDDFPERRQAQLSEHAEAVRRFVEVKGIFLSTLGFDFGNADKQRALDKLSRAHLDDIGNVVLDIESDMSSVIASAETRILTTPEIQALTTVGYEVAAVVSALATVIVKPE